MTNVIVNLLANSRGFTKGLDEAESGLAGFGNKTREVGQSMMKTGGLMTAGITLPALAAGKQLFSLGSDLEESISKVNVVFGDSAKEVQKWASTAAQSMGISNQAALEAAGTYGNLFQAFGLGRKEATEMSTELVQLASDLASFNNTSTEEAIQALRSGLSGETEPLKRYGVALSDARLKQEALALGLIKSTKDALTPAAKSQAAYNLIMKDTALAQGDYSRASDGAANTMKTLQATIADAGASLGTMLLPAVSTVAGALGDAAKWFNTLGDDVKRAGVIFIALAAAAGPVLTIIGSLVTIVGFLISPVGLVVAGIAALAAGFIYLYKTSEDFRNVANSLLEPLKGIAEAFIELNPQKLGEELSNLGGKLLELAVQLADLFINIFDKIDWGEVANRLLDGIDALKDALFTFFGNIDWGAIFQTVFKAAAAAFEGLGELLSGIDWGKVVDIIFDALGDAVILIGRTLKNINWGKTLAELGKGLLAGAKLVFFELPKSLGKLFIEILGKLGEEVGELLGTIDWGELLGKLGEAYAKLFKLVWFDLPKKIGEFAWNAIKKAWDFLSEVEWGSVLKTLAEAYAKLFKLVWFALPNKIGEFAWNAIKKAWDFITNVNWGDVTRNIIEAYAKLFSFVWTDLVPKVGRTIFNALKSAFQWVINRGGELLSGILNFFKQLPGKAAGAIGNIGRTLYQKGKDLIQGFLDGAGSLLTKIGEFFLDKVPGWIKTPFKKALGISSPSKLFLGYGKDLIQGLAKGLETNRPVTDAISHLTKQIDEGFNPSNPSFEISGNGRSRKTIIKHNHINVEQLIPDINTARIIKDALNNWTDLDGAVA